MHVKKFYLKTMQALIQRYNFYKLFPLTNIFGQNIFGHKRSLTHSTIWNAGKSRPTPGAESKSKKSTLRPPVCEE